MTCAVDAVVARGAALARKAGLYSTAPVPLPMPSPSTAKAGSTWQSSDDKTNGAKRREKSRCFNMKGPASG